MRISRMYFKNEVEIEDENISREIPPDDGHQMSQTEIDNLIALLLNN